METTLNAEMVNEIINQRNIRIIEENTRLLDELKTKCLVTRELCRLIASLEEEIKTLKERLGNAHP